MVKEKCDTCQLRYVCEEQAEFMCKQRNYCDYNPDRKMLQLANEKRLIDANAVLKHFDGYGFGQECDAEIILDYIAENEPTVYTAEVRHGRWIKQWCDNNMIGHEFAECPECGCSMLDTNQFWDCNYCPNCGIYLQGDTPCNINATTL